jgi:hypothetical protein
MLISSTTLLVFFTTGATARLVASRDLNNANCLFFIKESG